MMKKPKIKRKDLLYPELSYQIIGILFDVYNRLGPKYQERYYQKAVASVLKSTGLSFREQIAVNLNFQGDEVAKGFIDFIIEDKIILEIKTGERFLKSNISQVYSYLKITNLKLGILANFTPRGLQFRRIVNLNNS